MIVLIILFFGCIRADAAVVDVEVALRNTYTNCVGIDEQLSQMKKMAGINTAVTGVGTGLGIGAVAVGIAKKNVDAALEQKFQTMGTLAYSASGDVDVANSEDWLKNFKKSDGPKYDGGKNTSETVSKEKFQELNDKSKKLGHWRTGLMVGNTATNMAGAMMAVSNKADETLQEQINACVGSVEILHRVIMQAKLEGIDVAEAEKIESECKEFEYVNISKINSQAKGSMVSSIVGGGTGVAGVITSALANSDKIRRDDTNAGQQKEKNLNTAANVLAAGSTVASATATVFNAAQIKAIQDAADIAKKCTEALK